MIWDSEERYPSPPPSLTAKDRERMGVACEKQTPIEAELERVTRLWEQTSSGLTAVMNELNEAKNKVLLLREAIVDHRNNTQTTLYMDPDYINRRLWAALDEIPR